MDKSSSTQTHLLISSSTTPAAVLVTIIICISSIYIIVTQKHLPIYSSLTYLQQHPLLVLNLIILLILISSRCFARYKSLTHDQDDDPMLLLPSDPPQRITNVSSQERIAELETHTIKPHKQEKLRSTLKKKKKIDNGDEVKEGLNVKPEELLKEPKNENMKSAELLRDPKQDDEGTSTTKLRKNVSLTKEEVNRRVEAFIRKFNDDNYSL